VHEHPRDVLGGDDRRDLQRITREVDGEQGQRGGVLAVVATRSS
jgi:hypothetical protein